MSACDPISNPWQVTPQTSLSVRRCQPTALVSTTEVPFSSGGGLLASRPGLFARLQPGGRALTTFPSDPRVGAPQRVVDFLGWPQAAGRSLRLRGARVGFVALAGNQAGEPTGLLRLDLDGSGLSFDPLFESRLVHAADIAHDGAWLAVVSDRNLASLRDQPSEVVFSNPSVQRLSFDGGVSALSVTVPNIVSMIDSSGPRVLVGDLDLQLPACRASSLPVAPVVAPFPGGWLVARHCASSVMLARYSVAPIPDATLEVKTGALFSIAAVVDGAGRVALASWADDDPTPTVLLFHLDDLSVAREPVSLPRLSKCSRAGFLAIEVDPATPGRFAVQHSQAIGHGAGCAAITRLELCAPP